MGEAHTYHDPEQAHLVLKDGCPRCAEHAVEPWYTVDRDRLDVLIDKALAWEGDGEGPGPESENERRACQSILDALDAVRALTGVPNRRVVVEGLVLMAARAEAG